MSDEGSDRMRRAAVAHVALFAWGAGLVLSVGVVGADLRWLAALGRVIRSTGGIPDGIPWATAATHGWTNVPVLAELLLDAVARGGDRALLAAQAVSVGLTFAIAAGRKGVVVWPVAVVLPLAAATTVGVARVGLFSLPFFALLCQLLRSDAAAPSRRLLLVVPGVALWSNLHGGVLVGVGLIACYLALGPAGSLARRLGIAAATLVATCATPALWSTPAYYAGVLGSEPARRRVDLWGSLSPTSVLSWLLVAGVFVLALRAWPRLALYERLAAAGLAVATVRAERTGIWLLILLACAASESRGRLRLQARPLADAALAAAGATLIVLAFARAPEAPGSAAVGRAVELAAGRAILAPPDMAERVVMAGGRVWISDPIDAFRRSDQQTYLDWLAGSPSGDLALSHAAVVLVEHGTKAEARAASRSSLHPAGDVAGYRLYLTG